MSENLQVNYSEENIRTLDWQEHIRLRPGMYIGKLGDGSSADDGIYILLKEIIDNSIDEFRMKSGKRIEIKLDEGKVTIRDYGRGIPLGKVVDAVSKMNTGGKYDSKAFKKSVGLNGVGTKAVNALSDYFKVRSFRDGKMKVAEFSKGNITENHPETDTSDRNGTEISFIPDSSSSSLICAGRYNINTSICSCSFETKSSLEAALYCVIASSLCLIPL